MKVRELKELQSLEEVKELTPGATYLFVVQSPIPMSVAREIEEYFKAQDIKAVVIGNDIKVYEIVK